MSLIGFTRATTELEKLIPGATCSRYSLFGKAERKATYRCRELTLIPVSLPKYFTLVGTNFIESANRREDWRSPLITGLSVVK
ncbi:hypothetical protein [Microcoleus sp. D2_18a_B4]|uniref:hypothetical protein n=1 Tax=Microcoleus sp. D2_18a_B4 TaxID=3055329 RepID=UPI002FD2C6D4